MIRRSIRRQILGDAAAVSLATGTYGVSFGAIAVTSGLSVAQTCALSLLAFTGASQLAFVGVLGAGGSLVSGTLTALLLGTRNTLYAVRLAPLLSRSTEGGGRVPSPLAAHLVIDESTAMSVSRATPEESRLGFWATGLGVFALWNAATLVGALAGDRMGDPRDYGLDAAVGAAFLALLWPRLTTSTHRVTAALGAALAMSLVPLTPAGIPVLAAGVVALGMGLLHRGAVR